MATVSPSQPKLVEKLTWYTRSGRNTVWQRFSPEEQERMLADDLAAGTWVSVLLAALIATGMVLSIITLVAVMFMQ